MIIKKRFPDGELPVFYCTQCIGANILRVMKMKQGRISCWGHLSFRNIAVGHVSIRRAYIYIFFTHFFWPWETSLEHQKKKCWNRSGFSFLLQWLAYVSAPSSLSATPLFFLLLICHLLPKKETVISSHLIYSSFYPCDEACRRILAR